jgi:hypothetical protein
MRVVVSFLFVPYSIHRSARAPRFYENGENEVSVEVTEAIHQNFGREQAKSCEPKGSNTPNKLFGF